MKLFNYKLEPKNRQERRKVEKEIKAAWPVFMGIHNDLVKEMFSDSDDSYNEIYTKYLDLWNKTIDEWTRLKRLKYIFVNRYYLEEQYKPIENEERNR